MTRDATAVFIVLDFMVVAHWDQRLAFQYNAIAPGLEKGGLHLGVLIAS